MKGRIRSGVNRFDGVLTTWYGWARVEAPGHGYSEGPCRVLKIRARLDAWRLARKLAKS